MTFDRRKYAGYANDTKWAEPQRVMICLGLGRRPFFRVKTLNCDGERRWDGEWYYHFKCDYVWKDMEWVDLKPDNKENSIQLDEIMAICQRIGFELERIEEGVRIIGYRPFG